MSDWHVVRPLPKVEADAWSQRLRRLAHDANNGLVAVYAHLELLRAEDLSAAGRARAADLESALARFRTMARMLSHAAAREGAPDDASAIHAEMAAEAMRAGVGLRWSIAQEPELLSALPATVRDRVLRILIRNAIEAHTASSPRSAGKHPWIEVRVARDGASAQLTIRDNGPGCSHAARAACSDHSRAGLGHLGVGLAMAAAAMVDVGGSLAISSNDDGFTACAAFPIGGTRA